MSASSGRSPSEVHKALNVTQRVAAVAKAACENDVELGSIGLTRADLVALKALRFEYSGGRFVGGQSVDLYVCEGSGDWIAD